MELKDLEDKYADKAFGFVVGSGPSLNDVTHKQWKAISPYPVIAINSAIVKFSKLDIIFPHLHFLSDDVGVKHWEYYLYDLPKLRCPSILFKGKLKKHAIHLDQEKIIWFNHKTWFEPSTKKYYEDGLVLTKDAEQPLIGARCSSGTGVHINYIMGCKTIVLLGQDCSYNKIEEKTPKRYFWQYNDKQTKRITGEPVFCWPNKGVKDGHFVDSHCIEFLDYWKALARQAHEQGIKIVNASGGILNWFERKSIEELLKKKKVKTDD